MSSDQNKDAENAELKRFNKGRLNTHDGHRLVSYITVINFVQLKNGKKTKNLVYIAQAVWWKSGY